MSDRDKTQIMDVTRWKKMLTHASIIRRFRNWLWGYDYFISYHWATGGEYAVNLAQRLREKKYEVFLDRGEYAMGDDWLIEGQRALANTKRLIVVATRSAVFDSDPVYKEVSAFMARSRSVVPIVFDGELTSHERKECRVFRLMPETTLYVSEVRDNLSRGPSAATIQQLEKTHNVLRRRSLRSRVVGVAIALLTLSTIVTAWQRMNAVASRDNLAMQLAKSDYVVAHEQSQAGRDFRNAFLHAIRAASVAPPSDARRSIYLDRAMLLATQLPNRIVNLADASHEPIKVILSQDLRFLIAVTTAFQVEAWDLESGNRLSVPTTKTIAGFSPDPVTDERQRGLESLAISPDSKLALALTSGPSYQDELHIWELTSGRSILREVIDSGEGAGRFLFSDDSKAVMQEVDANSRSAGRNTNWKTVWEADVERNPQMSTATPKIGVALSLTRPEVLYRGSRPFDVVHKPSEDDESVVIARDANGKRAERWLAAMKSANGETLACVSPQGFVAFWRVGGNPFVTREKLQDHLVGLVGRDGQRFAVNRNGILTRYANGVAPLSVQTGTHRLRALEGGLLRLDAEGKHLLFWFRGLGTQEHDHRNALELREAESLQLLYERLPTTVSEDDWFKDLAISADGQWLAIAQGNADSDYFYAHRMRFSKQQQSSHKLQFPTGEFVAFTHDGEYAIVTRNNTVELVPTDASNAPPSAALRFSAQETQQAMLWMLRHAYALKASSRGVAGKLFPNAELLIVADPSGAKVVVNTDQINTAAGVSPMAWSSNGRRWLGILRARSSGGEFGTEEVAYLVDASTGFQIGEFSIPGVESHAIGFTHHDSAVTMYGSNELIRIATSTDARGVPSWFRHFGAAVTGIIMGDSQSLQTLSPAKHQAERRAFAKDLELAVQAGDVNARVIWDYFFAPPAQLN